MLSRLDSKHESEAPGLPWVAIVASPETRQLANCLRVSQQVSCPVDLPSTDVQLTRATPPVAAFSADDVKFVKVWQVGKTERLTGSLPTASQSKVHHTSRESRRADVLGLIQIRQETLGRAWAGNRVMRSGRAQNASSKQPHLRTQKPRAPLSKEAVHRADAALLRSLPSLQQPGQRGRGRHRAPRHHREDCPQAGPCMGNRWSPSAPSVHPRLLMTSRVLKLEPLKFHHIGGSGVQNSFARVEDDRQLFKQQIGSLLSKKLDVYAIMRHVRARLAKDTQNAWSGHARVCNMLCQPNLYSSQGSSNRRAAASLLLNLGKFFQAGQQIVHIGRPLTRAGPRHCIALLRDKPLGMCFRAPMPSRTHFQALVSLDLIRHMWRLQRAWAFFQRSPQTFGGAPLGNRKVLYYCFPLQQLPMTLGQDYLNKLHHAGRGLTIAGLQLLHPYPDFHARLQSCIRRISLRHEALLVRCLPGKKSQGFVHFHPRDVISTTDAKSEKEARQKASEFRLNPFDLALYPPFRVLVVELPTEDRLLMLEARAGP